MVVVCACALVCVLLAASTSWLYSVLSSELWAARFINTLLFNIIIIMTD